MIHHSLQPSETDYRALARVRNLIRCFLVFSERAARGAGLQPQQHQLLLAVRGLPDGVPPTILALAGQLQHKHHSVVELVNRLVLLGMVRRHRNPSDQREVRVEITAKGNRSLGKLSMIHLEELRKNGPQLLPALAILFSTKPKGPDAKDSNGTLKQHPGRARARRRRSGRR